MKNLTYSIIEQYTTERRHTAYGMALEPSQNTVTVETSRDTTEIEKDLIIEELENDIIPADEIYFEFEVIK